MNIREWGTDRASGRTRGAASSTRRPLPIGERCCGTRAFASLKEFSRRQGSTPRPHIRSLERLRRRRRPPTHQAVQMTINNLRNFFRTNRTPSADSTSSPAQRQETVPERRASQAAPASPYGIPTGRRHQAAATAEDGRRHRVQIGNPTPRSDAARHSGSAAGATMAGPGRMPNREVVEGALRILGGTDRSNITGMSHRDAVSYTHLTLPTKRIV